MAQDSHLSQPGGKHEHPPIRLQKRRALGNLEAGVHAGVSESDKVHGGCASTEKKIGNAPCTY